MNVLFRTGKFANYLLNAKTKYYLHSPFVYQFYLNVLEGGDKPEFNQITSLRNELKRNKSQIPITDFGTGSSSSKSISEIESKVCIKHKYGKLLYHLVKYFNSQYILEIGTSIGISSSYLALANPATKIISLEGSPAIAEIAKQNHLKLKIENVEVMIGNFNDTLSLALEKFPKLDLIFFDGNHTKQATLKYFELCLQKASENSVFVFDDICWNEEMWEAWNAIKKNPNVTLTLDLYQFGICFFRKEKLAKEDFVLLY